MKKSIKQLTWVLLTAAICFAAACQPNAVNTNTNTNANMMNVNSNMNANVSNANSMNANMSNVNAMNDAAVDTKEPEQYQANVSLKFETTGGQNTALPPLKAAVARSGANRRMEFVLPNGDKLIYLDANGKQYIVSPTKKQYAELNKESTGIEVRKLLMPDQIVQQIKNIKGLEKVGEEKFNGRDAVKYRYDATTNTQTKAGTVNTESVIYIDKETGLPLQSVVQTQSANNSVNGVNGIKLITEMTDIKTETDAAMFTEPTEYQKVAPEAIKSQIDLLFKAAAAIVGQVLQSSQQMSQ